MLYNAAKTNKLIICVWKVNEGKQHAINIVQVTSEQHKAQRKKENSVSGRK